MIRYIPFVFALLFFVACDQEVKETSNHAHTDMDSIRSMIDSSNMQSMMDAMMKDMHEQKPTGNIDVDYAHMMLIHHQGAIKMAQLHVEKGSDPKLKEFSKKVISSQMAEIDSFKNIIAVTDPKKSPNDSLFQQAIQSSMQPMMAKHEHDMKDIDSSYARMMQTHHQGAVGMAKAYLQYGKHDGLKKISNSIINEQSKEIIFLNEWL